MSGEDLTQGKNESLRGLGKALVRRFLDDAERFKVNPHRVSGIGKATVGECIRRQQVTEFIVHDRFWNRLNRQQGRPECEGEQSHYDYGKCAPACKMDESAL